MAFGWPHSGIVLAQFHGEWECRHMAYSHVWKLYASCRKVLQCVAHFNSCMLLLCNATF